MIDTFSGQEVRIGQVCQDPLGNAWKLLAIQDRLFSVRGLIEFLGPGRAGETLWLPLEVRFTHPQYFGRRVAFVPT